eukprot:scaffold83965_cov43-Prasinocladus_malaysianus.AAC.2
MSCDGAFTRTRTSTSYFAISTVVPYSYRNVSATDSLSGKVPYESEGPASSFQHRPLFAHQRSDELPYLPWSYQEVRAFVLVVAYSYRRESLDALVLSPVINVQSVKAASAKKGGHRIVMYDQYEYEHRSS